MLDVLNPHTSCKVRSCLRKLSRLLADFKFNCIQLIKGVGEKKEDYLNSVSISLGVEMHQM